MNLIERPRRLRRTETIRALVRETRLSPDDFVYPLFVCEGEGVRREISSMPGVCNLSIDELVKEVDVARKAGVRSVILFGVPDEKDSVGSQAYAEDGITQRAIRAIKREVKDTLVIADNCLCEYTDHGHCGVIESGEVLNDPSVELLARTVKYAAGFYGPFREAAQSAPQLGDRRGYQMDPANSREAMREAELDFEQGADMLMVKPALPYLDIIRAVRERFDLPVAAYQVSGEFSMIKAAAKLGWIDEERVAMEALTSIKRAGASIILTYYAVEIAKLLS